MNSIIHSHIGFIHIVSACFALVFGSLILAKNKGTLQHKKFGYAYAISMIVLNLTAFRIYRLFGGFGPFHVTAIISLLTLLSGMIPVMIRKPEKSWLSLHSAFMYYSVIGLYAAFVSEVITRIPGLNFGLIVGLSTTVIMILGIFFFRVNKSKWDAISKR